MMVHEGVLWMAGTPAINSNETRAPGFAVAMQSPDTSALGAACGVSTYTCIYIYVKRRCSPLADFGPSVRVSTPLSPVDDSRLLSSAKTHSRGKAPSLPVSDPHDTRLFDLGVCPPASPAHASRGGMCAGEELCASAFQGSLLCSLRQDGGVCAGEDLKLLNLV